MPAVYIHIPFCRRKCHYCDFYSVARPALEQKFVDALCIEIKQAVPTDETAQTIYFGGGTPSLISPASLETIMHTLHQHFRVPGDAEITLEANPEDINQANLSAWRSLGFNRLSIGIQSLDEEILKFLGRKHSSTQSLRCLDEARDAGFSKLSADLIYGIPGLTQSGWEHDIYRLLSTGIQHLSAYHLSIEPGTILQKHLNQGRFTLPDDETSYRQFTRLFEITEQEGFPWYEISNFSKPGYHSKHNSSYWNDTPYYGFGPSAHSYDGKSRRWWNTSNIKAYLNQTDNSSSFEILSDKDKLNDYLITHLRTRTGLDFAAMEKLYPDADIRQLKRKLDVYIQSGKARFSGNNFSLTPESLFISDSILKDILYI
jgi:oxygen-independent coproporphyrinogen-3 oxidase